MADGKLYVPETPEAAAQDFLDDIDLEARGLGVTNAPIQYGTDWWILSRALGQFSFRTSAKCQAAEADGSYLDATGPELDKRRKALGLSEIVATVARGRVVPEISGTRVLVDREPLTANGLRYVVDGTQSGLTDGDEVNVVSIDKGTAANLDADALIEFDNPPLGIKKTAKVSAAVPVDGATDTETDDRKRARILNRMRNPPAGGNPGHLIELSLNALASADGAYVHPALGGPGSAKVIATKGFDRENLDFSRALDPDALAIVRRYVQAEVPFQGELPVETPNDEAADVALLLDIPDSAQAGGDGTGWIDETPWPPTDTGGSGTGYDYVTITGVTTSIRIVLDAATSTLPVAGVTNLAWWSSNDMCFYVFLVITVNTPTPGAYDVTVDRPMVDSDDNAVAAGDFICPAAVNVEGYGKTWLAAMEQLGPGEQTSDAYRLPRSLRVPDTSTGAQSELNARVTRKLIDDHEEVAGVEYSYRSKTTPTVPGSVVTPPNILVPQHFGVYPTE